MERAQARCVGVSRRGQWHGRREGTSAVPLTFFPKPPPGLSLPGQDQAGRCLLSWWHQSSGHGGSRPPAPLPRKPQRGWRAGRGLCQGLLGVLPATRLMELSLRFQGLGSEGGGGAGAPGLALGQCTGAPDWLLDLGPWALPPAFACSPQAPGRSQASQCLLGRLHACSLARLGVMRQDDHHAALTRTQPDHPLVGLSCSAA